MKAKATALSKAGAALRRQPWWLRAIATPSLALVMLGTLSPLARATAPETSFAPTGLIATAETSSQVNLTWTAPNGTDAPLSRYDIYQGTSSGGESSTPVQAVSPAETSVSPQASATIYPTPTGLTATAAGSTRANLTWTAPDAPGLPSPGYDIYEGTSPGAESSTPVNTGPVTATSYTVPGLTSGTTYYFDVIALYPSSGDCQIVVCAHTASAPSNETSVTAAIGSLSTTRGTSTGTPTSPSQESNQTGTPGGGPTGAGKPSGHRKPSVNHDRSALTTGRTEAAGGTVPLLAILMAVTLVVLAAGLIFRWHQLRSGPSLPPQASVKAVTRAGPPAAVRIQTTGTGLAHAVRIEPYAGTRSTTIEEVRS
jgi:fibronectin type III domain protein